MSNVRGIIALNLSVAAQCSGARDEVCCAWQHIFYVGISAGSESLASPVVGQCGTPSSLRVYTNLAIFVHSYRSGQWLTVVTPHSPRASHVHTYPSGQWLTVVTPHSPRDSHVHTYPSGQWLTVVTPTPVGSG